MKFLTKVHFRSEAMRLFEADCPRQLVTEMGLAQRKRREDKRTEQVVTFRKSAKLLIMFFLG